MKILSFLDYLSTVWISKSEEIIRILVTFEAFDDFSNSTQSMDVSGMKQWVRKDPPNAAATFQHGPRLRIGSDVFPVQMSSGSDAYKMIGSDED